MKLFLMRHSIAALPSFQRPDFERPLTADGVERAQRAGVWLASREESPTLIVHSSATRTTETAKHVNSALRLDKAKIRSSFDLYGGDLADYADELEREDPGAVVLLIAHNPSISMAVEALTRRICSLNPAECWSLYREDGEDWMQSLSDGGVWQSEQQFIV